jgi:hypothetical protein
MWSKAFWKATTERVIASIAGGALGAIGAETFGVVEADWLGIASVAAGAGVVSLLKALAVGYKDGNPSAINAEVIVPDGDGAHRL